MQKVSGFGQNRTRLEEHFLNNQESKIWQTWSDRLKRWGMNEFAAAFLEASGPLNLVGAQLVYISQPVLSGIVPAGQINALASLLEEPERTEAFVKSLREVDS
jgi:hypothetical protein